MDVKRVSVEVIDLEIQALSALKNSINEQFINCYELILNCPGHVVVTGIGKSGHIGTKIAATLSSTGTPAFFLHPAEGIHGDLGMLTSSNIVLALSKSGNTKEIIDLLPTLKQQGIPLIALTCNADSILAKQADAVLLTPIIREACHLNLAPTSSTTAALVMGDALAIALSQAKRFTAQDFAGYHPGGTLGRQLTLRVADICHSRAEIPMVLERTTLADTLIEITRKKTGVACVIDSEDRLAGLLTDGDIRRILINNHDIYTLLIADVMTRKCITISPEQYVVDALSLMKKHSITALVVTSNDRQVLGLLTIHDLLCTGIFLEEEYSFIEQQSMQSPTETFAV
ncbi:MAG: KpsF/GutQ family sugar-phosphate isomerase [Legionella sp.]|uniref:KpsF/GutQ family sugar-phosphate isomerase n=1 Tax=Legionella sp. TaxID=459 RepID=UPI0039E62BDC